MKILDCKQSVLQYCAQMVRWVASAIRRLPVGTASSKLKVSNCFFLRTTPVRAVQPQQHVERSLTGSIPGSWAPRKA